MKKILFCFLVGLIMLSAPVTTFAETSMQREGYNHGHVMRESAYSSCYHTYRDSATGSEHDKIAPDGRIERVQTYTARCSKCGDYYYWDKHLYWYA